MCRKKSVSKENIKRTQFSQNIGLSVVCKINPFIWCKGKQWLAFTAIINYFAHDTCRTERVLQKVREMKGFPQGHVCHSSASRNRLVLQMYFMVLGVFLEGGRRMGWKDSII